MEVTVGSGVTKGSAPEIIEAFRRYTAAGLDHAVINFGYDLDIARRQARRFAEQCMPELA